ncbi:TPA: hypothetical protein ACH3X2_011960 [Trebouxia sp. C0005]
MGIPPHKDADIADDNIGVCQKGCYGRCKCGCRPIILLQQQHKESGASRAVVHLASAQSKPKSSSDKQQLGTLPGAEHSLRWCAYLLVLPSLLPKPATSHCVPIDFQYASVWIPMQEVVYISFTDYS